VSSDQRVAAARQSPRSATRPKGARQPEGQQGSANSILAESAGKAIRPQRCHLRPRESARDVREVVRDVLRPPE
jgi:hypothetical protein